MKRIMDEEEIGYITDPNFWEMIARRRKSKGGIPLEKIEADLKAAEASMRKGARATNGNGKKHRKGKSS